jgi:hypothetical protein
MSSRTPCSRPGNGSKNRPFPAIAFFPLLALAGGGMWQHKGGHAGVVSDHGRCGCPA